MPLSYGFCLGDITSEYTSAQFSDAIHSITGSGISLEGAQFSVTVSGFNATVASGYALAAGRWLQNDSPHTLAMPPSGSNGDRVDALAVHVDYKERKVFLTVLEGVDPVAIRENLGIIRGETEYNLILFFVRIRRRATTLSPEDITDVRAEEGLCGCITPLSHISADVLYVYEFLTGGIDREIQRILDMGKAVEDKANSAIAALDEAISRKRGVAIGDVIVTLSHPVPQREWLLCNGGLVPAEYAALYTMLGGRLPNIRRDDERFKGYIYGGTPVDETEPEEPDGDTAIVGYAVVGTAIVGKDVT